MVVALAEQPAAEPEILVGEDDARAGSPGGQRRGRPAGPPPTTSTSQCAADFS